MIEIGINPNTKQASVAIVLHGYFGLGRDGIKLVDQDTVFEQDRVELAGELPTGIFDTLQKRTDITAEKQHKVIGRPFVKGQSGNPKGRPVGSGAIVTDDLKELLEFKHYEKKDGTRVVARSLMAESMLDRAILQGNTKLIEIILDRVEGKVTQGVKLSGGLYHGKPDDEEMERLLALFPKT